MIINFIKILFARIYIGIIIEVVINNSSGVDKSIRLLIKGAKNKPVIAPKIL